MLTGRAGDCRHDLFSSMLHKYDNILQHDSELKILILSGDVDGIVPVIGTRRWLASLQLPILEEWRPWFSRTGKLNPQNVIACDLCNLELH